jgi:hypothetical protein
MELCSCPILSDQVSRRGLLGSIAGTAAAIAVPGIPLARTTIFTPESFGAKADGRTDDYAALKRLAAAVTAAGGGLVRFGRGRHYLINQIQARAGPNRNDISHISYFGCRGLRIDLNGATVHVKGNFHRSGDADGGQQSHRNAVIPFLFEGCVDLIVENGTLNGNADQMTRDPLVNERGGHGIHLLSSNDVRLEGLHLHHFSADGIRLGIDRTNEPCRRVRLNHVRCTNNARQGLTNAGAVDVIATDCEFSGSGRTRGSYRHRPMAGVDVEPLARARERSDFRAVRCLFADNMGAPVVATGPHRVSFVELIDCSGIVESQKRLILWGERNVIQGGAWHNIQIACAYGAKRPFDREIDVEVAGGLWTGNDPRWAPVYDMNPRKPRVRILNNRFELRPKAPFKPTFLFQCANPNHEFQGNLIFVGRMGHDGTGDDLVGNFQGAKLVGGNHWRTDASVPLRFLNNCSDVRFLEAERFSGSFAMRE